MRKVMSLRNPAWYLIALAGFVLGATVTSLAQAQEFSVGVQQSLYTEESSAEWSFGGKVAHEAVPVYFWGSYEAPRAKILGQPMGDTDIFSVGLGATQDVSEGVSVFVEAGYSFLDLELNDAVVDEVTYTWLANRHGADGNRTVPVRCAYNPGCYSYSYEVDDGFMARIGAEWALSEHVSVTGAYKWTYLDQEMTIKAPSWQEGQGYWREDATLNLSAFEVGIWYTF